MSAITVFLWILIVLFAAWMAMRFLPSSLDHGTAVPDMTALVTLLAIPLLIIAVWALARRSWAQGICSVILVLLNVTLSAGYFFALPDGINRLLGQPVQSTVTADELHTAQAACSASADDEASSRCIRIMTLNSRYGKADASAIVHAVKQHGVTVLALQEVSDDMLASLEKSGIGDILPYMTRGEASQLDNGGFNVIFSQSRPTATTENAVNIRTAHVPQITLDIQGTAVRIASAHTASPHRGTDRWHDGIEDLAALGDSDSSTHGTPSIVVGDLNATMSHPSFRDLLVNGAFTDASYELHSGTHLSFPASWFFTPSLLELDHVLHTDGVTTADMTSVTIPRTDHRAQIATLYMQ
ncbi:MAG: endonuclease/exonuclease/phosphatase family protein [Bifidobacteriaceae bacterium]|nr:endonuclease/exonuclease/phosphatase family protein [Bifidobacteriaceae bacterium]